MLASLSDAGLQLLIKTVTRTEEFELLLSTEL